jgi:ABC-type transport system involved in multi-copper enzyme maturation permease subunit
MCVRPFLGPVFAYEWLTTTRRWQLYALRALFVGAILIGMIFVWYNSNRFANLGQTVSLQTLASYGENLYEAVVSIELTLVLLAAPAATAGAICLDKARGTLEHMLATDLSNSEIIMGKIGVRLVPVLGLVACVLPLTALTSLLGGIDPLALFGSFMTAIACAVLGCSLGLTLSVWGRKTHEVLMTTYLILILWLISPVVLLLVAESFKLSFPPSSAPTLWKWIECSNPYYLAFAPYTDPGKRGVMTYLGFLGICLGLSALLLSLATVRIRGVALRQAGRPAAAAPRRWFARYFPTLSWRSMLPGPSLDGNPVLWREWHRSKPSRLSRVVWILYSALGILWAVLSFNVVITSPANQEMIAIMTMVQVSLGLLLLSVSAATSLAEERVRGSLDVLLCTPLSTHSILVGKWWGSFLPAIHVLAWSALLAGILTLESGHWISYLMLLGLIAAYCAVITSLGLALATWVSRLGRAVALTVSVCVVFSIGWILLIFLVAVPNGSNDSFLVPMVMGSPLYGTIFTTLAVAPGALHLPGGVNAIVVTFGALIWIVVHSAAAFLLFMTTLASFDSCLGRVSEVAGRSAPFRGKKAGENIDPDLDECLVETSPEASG